MITSDIIQVLRKQPVHYRYCYNCDIVLGNPSFSYDAVIAEIEKSHKGHIFSQTEWDGSAKIKTVV